jgi:CTP synthase (UTP-ammonia lyase)
MATSPRVAIVGDYSTAKETHRATDAELAAAGVDFEWIPTVAVGDTARSLGSFHGIVIAPGSPYANGHGALAAVRHARERSVPLVGMCGGYQHVVLEFARNVLGVHDAEHAETNPDAENLAITPLTCSLVGQRHAVHLLTDSRAGAVYGTDVVVEPFYCSYGSNPALEPRLEAAGLSVSGRDAEGSARVVELDDHPFFIATLYVFQVREDRSRPHPLTAAFLEAARSAAGQRWAPQPA